MEKLKNTPLYIKTFVLLSALLWGSSVMGQPLLNEAFNYDDGTAIGTDWSSGDTDNATVQSSAFQLTAPNDNYSGVIWSSSVFEQVCTTDFFIEGDVAYSGSGSAILEYSTNGGSNWQEVVEETGVNAPQVQLRLSVVDILNTETVTLDNVKVYQEFSATVVSFKYCCNGLNDGEITVAACGGEDLYTYVWTGPDGYSATSATITGLEQGDYTVVVTETSTSEEYTLESIPIGEYSAVSVVYTGQDWSCIETPGCNGSISLAISGGTSPYSIEYVDGTPSTFSTNDTYSFENLCAGTYTINVTDDNGCVSTSGEQTITIVEDNLAPTDCVAPDDYTMDIASYLEDSSLVEISTNPTNIYSDNVTTDADTLLFQFDASGFNKLHYIFNIDPNDPGSEEWNDGDSIAFYLDYDADDVIDVRLGAFYNEYLETGNDTFRLPDIADDQGAIMLYVISYAGVNKSYILSFNQLQGNNMTSIIAANSSGAGEPTGCTDNYTLPGNIDIQISDGSINWVCNKPGNQEFWFERTFTVADECGNETDLDVQKIGVGEYPEIDEPRDTILDYCNNTNVGIPVPGYTDNSIIGCGKAVDFKYVLRDETDNEFISDGTIPVGITSTTLNFPQSVANDTTFVITWIATDEAGLQDSVKQRVTILKPITVTLTLTPDNTNFCSGEEVSFEFTIDGGTRSYKTILESDITPSGTLSGSDNLYTFTTSSLELGALETENITIEITDSDVSNYEGGIYSVQGGCLKTITFENGVDNGDGIPFTIHQNISTNPLERVD